MIDKLTTNNNKQRQQFKPKFFSPKQNKKPNKELNEHVFVLRNALSYTPQEQKHRVPSHIDKLMAKQSKITASNEKPLKTEEPAPLFNDDIANLCSEKKLAGAQLPQPKSSSLN